MAVVFDAKTAAVTNWNSTSPMPVTNLTVGGGSNRALLLLLFIGSSTTLPPGLAITWNVTQTLTQVSSTSWTDGGIGSSGAIYGLIAPNSGNNSFSISWTGGGSFEIHAMAVSFTGVDQTSIAVTFPHGATNIQATFASPATVTITTAIGNMVVAGHTQNTFVWATTSGTEIAHDDVAGPNLGVDGNYDNGAASPVALTAAWTGTTTNFTSFGCDVLASASAPPIVSVPLGILGFVENEF